MAIVWIQYLFSVAIAHKKTVLAQMCGFYQENKMSRKAPARKFRRRRKVGSKKRANRKKAKKK